MTSDTEPVRVLLSWAPRRWGVRRRSVVSALVVVGVALAVGAAVLVFLLQSALVDTARQAVVREATDLAAVVSEQGVGDLATALPQDRRAGEIAQVIGPDGAVVASSSSRLAEMPLADLRPAAGVTQQASLPELVQLADSDDYLVAARGVAVDDLTYVVLVASPVQVQTDTIRTVGLFLLGATPLILVLVGFAVWVLVGSSLRTVDRIREQVDVIDTGRLADRVDVPETGDEVARLASTMNTMLARLQASDAAQRAFFSDASHELRSPLSTLVTTAEVGAGDPTGRTWAELQPTVLSEATRMQALVEDLLTLARADAHALLRPPVEVDLEDVVDREVRRLRLVTPLTVTVQLNPTRVRGDAGRLSQVVRNLLDNAAQHAVHAVRVSTRVTDAHAVVEVDNDGPPVPLDQRTRVFERFVRLEESRSRECGGHTEGGGSGLGLAITRVIVEAHGGTVEATEDAEGWCRFVVTLPGTAW